MESRTYLKNLHVSPKKLRLFLAQIKKMKPSDTLDYLFYSQNKPARIFYQAIKSALANAKRTLKVNEDVLKFKVLTVEEGQKLKRFRAGGRGTAKPIKRRWAHIKIILEAEEAPKEKVKKIKSTKKKNGTKSSS